MYCIRLLLSYIQLSPLLTLLFLEFSLCVCVCVCYEDTVSYGNKINMFYFRSSAALTPCDYSNFINTFVKQFVFINVLRSAVA